MHRGYHRKTSRRHKFPKIIVLLHYHGSQVAAASQTILNAFDDALPNYASKTKQKHTHIHLNPLCVTLMQTTPHTHTYKTPFSLVCNAETGEEIKSEPHKSTRKTRQRQYALCIKGTHILTRNDLHAHGACKGKRRRP